jgi:hypothetical protein
MFNPFGSPGPRRPTSSTIASSAQTAAIQPANFLNDKLQELDSEINLGPTNPEIYNIVIGFLEASLNSSEEIIMNFIDQNVIKDLIELYYRILNDVMQQTGKRPSEILMAFLHLFCVHSLARTHRFSEEGLEMVSTGNYLENIFLDFGGINRRDIGYPTSQAPYSRDPFASFTPARQRTSEFAVILKSIDDLMISGILSSEELIQNYNRIYDNYLQRQQQRFSEQTAASALIEMSGQSRGGYKKRPRKSNKSKRSKGTKRLKRSKKSKKSRK